MVYTMRAFCFKKGSNMGIVPLTKDEIKKMEWIGRLAGRTLTHVGKFVRPGVSTNELDQIVVDFTKTNNARAATLGYHGYPKSICSSINSIICHGVPDDETVLKEGDIINLDITSEKDGFFGDCSATFFVGEVSKKARDLVQAALDARDIGIEAVRPGGTTGDIGFAIDKLVTRRGFTTVKEIGGHGIGKKFHDEPFVPSFGKKGRGDVLVPWQCITVEPMVNEGTDKIKEFDIAGSSHKYYVTSDGKLSAQFEHTILVTDTGFEILTLD
jgi:methionyl aminopeptidase